MTDRGTYPYTIYDGEWHSAPLQQIFAALGSTPAGLGNTESAQRQKVVGPNKLPERQPPTLAGIFIRQFRSPFIYILGIAAVVSVSLGDIKDALFILGVLVINAVIGTFQEWKAERSTLALRKLLRIQATVQREGEIRDVSAEELVPGDVIWLESGNRVPADVRLIMAHGLEVDESLLTGESLPINKDSGWSGQPDSPLAERLNMAHAGSIVTRGRASGMVVSTGARTAVGQLAIDVISETGGKSPLLIRMQRFTNVVAISVLVAVIVVAAIALTRGMYAPSEIFLFAVALAVSAIPEGLPVAMTVALAVATTRMARRGVIVRRLTAVEGLGSCTYIGSDKTGTLTRNELTVTEVCAADGKVYGVTGEGFTPQGRLTLGGAPVNPVDSSELDALIRAGVLCNEADLHQRDSEWIWRGDTVDIALLALGHKAGRIRAAALTDSPLVNQIPFEPELRFAATFHRVGGGTLVVVKGAPERVLEMCGTVDVKAQLAVMNAMAGRGLRVLAFADGFIPEAIEPSAVPPQPSNLRFLGFTGMIDPLRSGTREAVRECQRAGITVSMITGDHRVTAFAISRDLGLADSPDQVISGAELGTLSAEQLVETVKRARVFARVAPRQKLEIVEAAQKAGHFVAVTGDGVNDAPALRAANVGVSMGKSGTDVAREASELVISDDNFATIVAGVEEGRVAYDNIRKVIYLLISTGAAELILMGMAIFTGSPLPLLPVQILWLNLVTNGIQDVALAFEPNEGGVLHRRPRPPRERIFNRLMIERTLLGALTMAVVGFVLFQWLLPENPTDDDLTQSRNMLLLLMVLFENVHIGNCRSETRSALTLSPLRSPILLSGTLLAFLVHFVAMHTPFGPRVLGAFPIALSEWALLIALSLIILPVMEVHKWSWRRRQGGQ